MAITPDIYQTWERNGFVKLAQFLDGEEVERLRQWVEEITAWPTSPGQWMHHHEQTEFGVRLARTENVLPYHSGMRAFLTEGKIPDTVSQLLTEPAVLYKEKINYKYPGGGGYPAHQDAPAYEFVKKHITCLIAIDPATPENGCLFFAGGLHTQGLLALNDVGCIAKDIAAGLDWEPVPMQPGDALFFSSYAPHMSPANTTNQPRRSLYLTYNALSEGDHREAYYDNKRQVFARQQQSNIGGDSRISKIGHFRGKSVPQP